MDLVLVIHQVMAFKLNIERTDLELVINQVMAFNFQAS